MDFEGHIALTDFGLSKRNIDHTGNNNNNTIYTIDKYTNTNN